MPILHLYLDESGSADPQAPAPNEPHPYFSMGGILLRDEDKATIASKVNNFKTVWRVRAPLHSVEIRNAKGQFRWLATVQPERRKAFEDDLIATCASMPIITQACVISRHGYVSRFTRQYGAGVWELRKSALSILLDRSAKYARDNGYKLEVTYEQAGKDTDELVERLYKSLKTDGLPFDGETSSKYAPLTAAQFAETLHGIRGRQKQNIFLQVADLMLWPMTVAQAKPDNDWLVGVKHANLLIDQRLEAEMRSARGIKYYCFG